jgi:hypothetical protein
MLAFSNLFPTGVIMLPNVEKLLSMPALLGGITKMLFIRVRKKSGTVGPAALFHQTEGSTLLTISRVRKTDK